MNYIPTAVSYWTLLLSSYEIIIAQKREKTGKSDYNRFVVFSFDQLTSYELLRGKKIVDDLETTGSTVLETGLTAASGIARTINPDSEEHYDYFRLKLATADPYWREINLKIDFRTDELYGFNGFSNELVELCRMLKYIIRKDSG